MRKMAFFFFIRSNFTKQCLEIPGMETAPMVSFTASPAELLSSTEKWAVWKRLEKEKSFTYHKTGQDYPAVSSFGSSNPS